MKGAGESRGKPYEFVINRVLLSFIHAVYKALNKRGSNWWNACWWLKITSDCSGA